jgi:flagellar motor switch protein FliN
MSDEVVYEQLEQTGESEVIRGSEADLRRLSGVPMEASVEIGRTSMTVGDTLDLRPGSIVVLDRMAGEPVDLYVNGTLLASGEVVVVDEQFGLRVNEIVEGEVGAAFALAGQNRAESAPAPVLDDGPAAGAGGPLEAVADGPADAGDEQIGEAEVVSPADEPGARG